MFAISLLFQTILGYIAKIQLANLLIFWDLSKTSQRLYVVLIIQNLDYLDIFCVNIFNKYSHDVYGSLSRMKCF